MEPGLHNTLITLYTIVRKIKNKFYMLESGKKKIKLQVIFFSSDLH